MAVEEPLSALAIRAWRSRVEPRVYMKARKLRDCGVDRGDKILLILDELHRLFTYRPDPTDEMIGLVQLEGGAMDADDACVLLMSLAMSVGIPCRIVGTRYRGYFCTCFVAYDL